MTAKVAAAACDFIQLRIADTLRASNPSGLQLIVDLALMPDINELNIVTLNHDTLVEQFLSATPLRPRTGALRTPGSEHACANA